MDNSKGYKTVEEYFAAQPDNTRQALLLLKRCIMNVVPDAVEMFNYNIPAYALTVGGKREQQIMIAGYKNHVGLYPHPSTMEKFDLELQEYKKGKGSLQFPLSKPLPTQLIERMIEYRKNLLANEITK